jgi:transaldolase/glucose-6-phosphate isomerase
MIKVPATPEGVPAVEQLTSEGINVNITLLFSRAVYRQVAEAHMSGLESLTRRGGDLGHMASVASIFVSRIDALVDPKLESPAATSSSKSNADLVGKVAIANAKLAYVDYKERSGSARWQALAKQGARTQRLLWASTSTKNPRFPDLLYVEALIGSDTVDTITPATLTALRDHGQAASRLEDGIDEARQVMTSLARAGISLDEITEQLLNEGVHSFSSAFDKLMAAIEQKREAVIARLAEPGEAGTTHAASRR